MTRVFKELVRPSWCCFDQTVEVMVIALLSTKGGGRSLYNLPSVPVCGFDGKFQEFVGIKSVLLFLGLLDNIQAQIWFI